MLFTLGWPAWMDAGVVCEYHLVPMEDMAKVLFLMSQRSLYFIRSTPSRRVTRLCRLGCAVVVSSPENLGGYYIFRECAAC
jgi:hypothetical protein